MATIVKLKHSGAKAFLVGVGYGQYRSEAPSAVLGNLASKTQSGTNTMAAVSAPDGTILWHPTDNIEVISVDGQSPADLLS